MKKYIMELTNMKGGCTINRQKMTPKRGYMVGIQGFDNIDDMLRQNLAENEYYGTWKDMEDNGKVYFDISTNIIDKAKAIELAKKRHELAIFDIENCESIYV